MTDLIPAAKSASAFRTIGEVAAELGVAQHVLRFWETRFPQVQPLKRGGNRRYYRPADVALLRDIHRMLHAEGYTIKGVQKLLADRKGGVIKVSPADHVEGEGATFLEAADASVEPRAAAIDLSAIRAIRNRLAAGLATARAA